MAETAEPGTEPRRNPRLRWTLPAADWPVKGNRATPGGWDAGRDRRGPKAPATRSEDRGREGRQRAVHRTTRVERWTLHYLSYCLSSRIKMVQQAQHSEARMARVRAVVREWPPRSGVRWRSSLNY